MNSRETPTVPPLPLCAGAGCAPRRGPAAGRGRRAVPGSRLCAACSAALFEDLRRMPALHRACGELLDGSRSMSAPRERTSGGALPGLPFNAAAAEARAEILAVLGSWAGLVVEARRLPRPVRTAEALAGFLVRQTAWLAAHPAAGDASRELREVARRAARAAAPGGERRPLTVGACPEPGCGGPLRAEVPPRGDGGAPAVRCAADPAHRWSGEELMRLRRRIDAGEPSRTTGERTVWLTAADITRIWGTPSGSVYRMASERAWRRRSRDGRTYYHEADVVRTLTSRQPRGAA